MSVHYLDPATEIADLRAERDELQRLLLNLLLAPFSDQGVRQMAQTAACLKLRHPRRWPGASRCMCGMRIYQPEEETT